MCIEVIAQNVIVVFFETQCRRLLENSRCMSDVRPSSSFSLVFCCTFDSPIKQRNETTGRRQRKTRDLATI